MNTIFKNKLIRGFALVPVGIGSVIGTIYLTNLNKPFELLDSLLFSVRPEIAEELLRPEIPIGSPSGGGGSGGSKGTDPNNDGGSGEGQGPGSGGSSEDIGQAKSEETTEKTEESEEQPQEESQTNPAGIEPEIIIKQVIKNISELDLSKVTKIETLAWLLNHFTQAQAAIKLLQKSPKAKEDKGTEESESTQVTQET